MSVGSVRLKMTHLCTIERDANAATANARGNQSAPNWQPSTSNLPCRVGVNAGQEAVDATTTAVVEDMRLIVALGTDVTERDRIANITYRGATVVSGPTGIRSVLWRQDHLELVLVRIS